MNLTTGREALMKGGEGEKKREFHIQPEFVKQAVFLFSK